MSNLNDNEDTDKISGKSNTGGLHNSKWIGDYGPQFQAGSGLRTIWQFEEEFDCCKLFVVCVLKHGLVQTPKTNTPVKSSVIIT